MKRKTSPSPKSPAARPTAAKSPRATASPRAKSAPASKPAVTKAKAAPAPASETTTKQSQRISLLRCAAGASMADMMALTGWQSLFDRDPPANVQVT